MENIIRIGTRESQLAVWQATLVNGLLLEHGFKAELVYIKSDGDIDLQTPLYEIGVQGIFTKSLDIALLDNRIDLAVHSMKDVPTRLAKGIAQAAVLKRGSYEDVLVFKKDTSFLNDIGSSAVIATSSIRRKAQWLNRYPGHNIENLRGNVNTRLNKVVESHWDGAIFALAGIERINLRPTNSIVLDWMLPAPAQGAIMVVCREDDEFCKHACLPFNDAHTELCTGIERDFLRTLMGGCSTPISALAKIENGSINFKGNVLSRDGKEKVDINMDQSLLSVEAGEIGKLGVSAANELLAKGGKEIVGQFSDATK